MKAPLSYPFILLVSLGVTLIAVSVPAAAQKTEGPAPVVVSFLKDSLIIEENTFSFNNIRLSNRSASLLHLQVLLSPPAFVDVISGTSLQVLLRPGESVLEAIRFTAGPKTALPNWAPFTVSVKVAETGELMLYNFLVMPKQNARWKAWLRQPSISLTELDRRTSFDIQLENEGNIPDTYTMNMITPLETGISKKDYRVMLQPGETRIITVDIDLSPVDVQHLRKEEVEIFIRNGAGEQRMLVQGLMRMGYLYSDNVSRWKTMPLTVGLNLFNLKDRQAFGFLDARGWLDLPKGDRLNILLQSDSYYKDHAGNTHIATAEYFHGPWKLQAGSILEFNNFLVDGAGARLQYKGKGGSVYEAMAVRSRTGNTHQLNFKTEQTLGPRVHFYSNTFVNQDRVNREDAYLTLNRMDWDLSGKSRLTLEAGAGLQHIRHQHLDTVLTGPQWGYHFETRGKSWQFVSGVTWYSGNIPGINKGFVYQQHEIRRMWNHFYTGGYIEYNKRSYSNPRDSLISQLFNQDNKEYGIRTGGQYPGGTWGISSGFFSQRQDSASAFRADMYKVSLSASWQFGRAWVSLLSNTGRVSLAGLSSAPAPFISTNNLLSVQAGHYGLQARWDKGPYYYYEVRQYLQSGTFLHRVQITPFAEVSLPALHLFSRVQLNYFHEMPAGANLLYAYASMQYAEPGKGWNAGLVTGFSLNSRQEPMINLSVHKQLLAPVYRRRQAKDFIVVLFLDRNGNLRPDPDEERVVNATVMVNGQLVFTNGRGEILFTNTDKEEFVFDFSRITTVRGWLPSGGNRQTLRPGRDKLFFLPFTGSHLLTGQLILERDPLSEQTMEPGGIRISAEGPHGEEYTTLTDEKGAFFFNLPAGDYIVRVNSAVFGEGFRPVETAIEADLTVNKKLDIRFEIRQDKRQMNIHKEEEH